MPNGSAVFKGILLFLESGFFSLYPHVGVPAIAGHRFIRQNLVRAFCVNTQTYRMVWCRAFCAKILVAGMGKK